MTTVDADAINDLKEEKSRSIRKLTPDMIQRMDEPPKPINPSGNPSGWVTSSEYLRPPDRGRSFTPTPESSEEFPSNRQARARSASPDIQSKKYVARLIATL